MSDRRKKPVVQPAADDHDQASIGSRKGGSRGHVAIFGNIRTRRHEAGPEHHVAEPRGTVFVTPVENSYETLALVWAELALSGYSPATAIYDRGLLRAWHLRGRNSNSRIKCGT